jgi:D-glycero-D-manno-heptose 1,7-bisphosphate phosphatase
VPGSLEAIARLNQAGYRVVVASNQSGIARGLRHDHPQRHPPEDAHAGAAGRRQHRCGVLLPARGADNCDCRKPKPGMFTEISQRYKISLKGVPVVGDSLRDLQAGYVSGCVPLPGPDRQRRRRPRPGGLPPGTMVFPDLAAMVSHLLKTSTAPAPHAAS